MNKRRSLIIIFIVLDLLGFLCPRGVHAAAPIIIKLGHVTSDKSPYHIGAVKFGELVDKYTEGKIKVEVYPNSMLGSARAMTEGLILGTLQMTLSTVLDDFEPKAAVVTLPYIFRDSDHAYRVLDSEIGQEIYGPLLAKGIRTLYIWESGWRHVVSKKPIQKLEDMKGMKIRTPKTELWIDLFKALGTNPTPMAYGEVYTGLQQGIVDGCDNPLSYIHDMKFYEVAPNVALTQHMYGALPVIISEKFWGTLSPEFKDAIIRAAKETTSYQRKYSQNEDAENMEKMKRLKVNFTAPDLEPFRKATASIYGKYEQRFGKELIQRIREFK